MEPKTGKKIVSKWEYMARLGKKAALRLGSISLLGGGGVVFLLAVCCFYMGVLLWSESVLMGLVWLTGFTLVLALAFWTFYISRKGLEQAEKIDTGVPLTRFNAADLPAPDSLVRASTEPMQEQQAVLLRAATEGQEKHEEQLLRAVAARQERE